MSLNPFCCPSVIPSTIIHLLSLLPKPTRRALLDPGFPSAPLITTFLSSLIAVQIHHSSYLLPTVKHRSDGSFRAIIQVSKQSPLNSKEAKWTAYYAPYGDNDRERIKVGEKVEVRGVMWKEISKGEADECLRPEGAGITIGDGEKWRELVGVEKFWCESHKVVWEVRGWVRETGV